MLTKSIVSKIYLIFLKDIDNTQFCSEESPHIPSTTPVFALISRMFANGPGDRGSIPGRVIPNTQKMVLDTAFLCTQHYKVRIKSKVEQSREWSRVLPYTTV